MQITLDWWFYLYKNTYLLAGDGPVFTGVQTVREGPWGLPESPCATKGPRVSKEHGSRWTKHLTYLEYSNNTLAKMHFF